MLLSKFVLPFLAIALSSLAKAASSELIQEELLVTCEGTPGIMGSAEMVFFGSTFVNIHNSANHINNDVIHSQVINNDDDGIVLNNATVIGQETHIETVRANLRANFPPNVESGWGTDTYSNLMRLIVKGGCTRCRRRSLTAETSPSIREDFSIALTNALRAGPISYFHSTTFNCTVGPIQTNVLAAAAAAE